MIHRPVSREVTSKTSVRELRLRRYGSAAYWGNTLGGGFLGRKGRPSYDSNDFDSRQGVVEPNDTPEFYGLAEGEPNVPFLLTLDPSDLAYWIICLSRIV
jgi:hypothetical protein